MNAPSAEAALDRLDRALSRIESAVAAGDQAREQIQRAYGILDSRHDRLRNRIAETISRLDGLIAEAQPTQENAR